jgi:hypothetical protein
MITGIPWRLIGTIALTAAVALAGQRVSAWHDAYKQLPDVKAELVLELECDEGSKCRERETELRKEIEDANKTVVDTLAAELAAVRDRPPVTVRLCPAASDVSVSRPTGRDNGTVAASGAFSGSATDNRDIGPELSALARQADEIVARCRGLQDWNRALAVEP